MPDPQNTNVVVAAVVGVLGSLGALIVQSRKDQSTVEMTVKNAVLEANNERLKEELDRCEEKLSDAQDQPS